MGLDPYRDSSPSGQHVRPQTESNRPRANEVRLGLMPARECAQHELSSDERRSNILHETSPAITGGIYTGRIDLAVPYCNYYRVALEGAKATIGCCLLSQRASLPFACSDAHVLPPNTTVLVHVPHGADHGIILGVIPELVADSGFVHPDWISQGSNCGFKREKYYWQLMTLFAESGGLKDFSSNRPMDTTALGEWAHFSHTGGGFFMDSFMQFMRMDETCGLWMFYLDRMLRLCGYNMDVRTAISERVIRNDQGEGYGFYGYNGYPWQVLGTWDAATQPHRVIEDEDVQYELPYGKYEVAAEKNDLQPFYRTEEYEGYCGQGFMRQVMLPPQGKTEGLNRYADTDPRIGVFREQIGYDGSYALQSAHSITLAKRILIPIPKRLVLPEDEANGDAQPMEGTGNYKFANQFGDGPVHKVGNPAATDSLPSYLTAAALTDLHANTFNWKGLHPFVYHAKDYDVPQEGDIPPFKTLFQAPPFATLASSMALPRPTAKPALVDSRYGEQDYFETTASFNITPDGCIVMRDAYGVEIKTGGGNIYWSCPGDFYIQPGRNLVVYSGDDVVLRARSSVDITAALHDVRVKAEVNCDIVAGNNGKQGRLLLENQAADILHDYADRQGEDVVGSGVIIKAANSQFAAMAAEVYVRTGVGTDGAAGDITLDANLGQRDIRTRSRVFSQHVENSFSIAIPSGDTPRATYTFDQYTLLIPAAVQIGGGVIVTQNGLQVSGGIDVINGHIATDQADSFQNKVPQMSQQQIDLVNVNDQTCKLNFLQANSNLQVDFQNGLQSEFYAEGKIGNTDLQDLFAFAPRTASQMDTTDWKLPESYWQQLARLDEQTPGTWTEPVIVYQSQAMMPHPGNDAWTGQNLLLLDLNYHDVQTGLDSDRKVGSTYEEPKLNDWQPQAADGAYIVIDTNY